MTWKLIVLINRVTTYGHLQASVQVFDFSTKEAVEVATKWINGRGNGEIVAFWVKDGD